MAETERNCAGEGGLPPSEEMEFEHVDKNERKAANIISVPKVKKRQRENLPIKREKRLKQHISSPLQQQYVREASGSSASPNSPSNGALLVHLEL